MKRIREFIRDHPKLSGALAAAAIAAGTYYGVPPGTSGAILKAVFGG